MTYWVKLRRWNEAARVFDYQLVEITTPYDTTYAGREAESRHRGWMYVEVWSFNPAGELPERGEVAIGKAVPA